MRIFVPEINYLFCEQNVRELIWLQLTSSLLRAALLWGVTLLVKLSPRPSTMIIEGQTPGGERIHERRSLSCALRICRAR